MRLRRDRALTLALFGLIGAVDLGGCTTPPPSNGTPPPKPATVEPKTSPPVDPKAVLDRPPPGSSEEQGVPVGPKPPLPPVAPESAPAASPRIATLSAVETLRGKVDSYFSGHAGRRIYVQPDKPLYKPGETVWLSVWDLKARTLEGAASDGMYIELISPRGAQVLRKKVHEQRGLSQVALDLGAGFAGGEYTVKVKTFDGASTERGLVISTYEPPRLKMQLEFVRKAYGPGDEVSATIAVKRPTGEALKEHPLTATVRLDGQDLPRVSLKTDDKGDGVVKFMLPQDITMGDALLTVLADDGGLTESVSKRVPIVVKKLQMAIYPEGGDLVAGLPGRIYFEAKNPLGKPADISGRVIDDTGTTVAKFETVRDGLGRVDLTPQAGRSYSIEVDRPVGVMDRYPVPPPLNEGCVLRSFDDLDGQQGATRVAVRCTAPRKVVVGAVLRETVIDSAAVEVPANTAAVVYLEPRGQGSEALAKSQGAVRVTLFDEYLTPLAERLVYRNRRARLSVKVTPKKKVYIPREKVELEITTLDAQDKPVPADLALGVVDDTVLSFADDKTGHILSRIYLEPELAHKVEEPNFYFDLSEAKSGLAMDLLMGTHGYRRFEWQPVLGEAIAAATTGTRPTSFADLRKHKAADPTPAAKPTEVAALEAAPEKAEKEAPRVAMAKTEAAHEQKASKTRSAVVAPDGYLAENAKPRAGAMAFPKPDLAERPARRADVATAAPKDAPDKRPMPMQAPMAAAPVPSTPAKPARIAANMGPALGRGAAGGMPKAKKAERAFADDMDRLAPAAEPMAGGLGDDGNFEARGRGPVGFPGNAVGGKGFYRPRPKKPVETWAPVRVFPAPAYEGEFSGVRSDFRETIAWQPQVQTGQDGKATVAFYLSDAVTSFRVVTEGAGGGAVGRDETVLKASLPFSMAVKLPLEVSEGDKLQLPLILSNERGQAVSVKLDSSFGTLLTLDKPVDRATGSVAANARDTLYYPLTVTGKQGDSEVRFVAEASGLRDEFVRAVKVSPRGFPQHVGKSGKIDGRYAYEFDLGDMLPSTGDGMVRIYTNPMSTVLAGLDGMLRQPSGCFEQTSSVNYPNVMILRYLKEQGISDARLYGKASRLIDDGYKKLIAFETPNRGYEWFGAAPGHEALTAYGLLEFADMRGVYGDVDKQMMQRTADWLRGRRDGKGGYMLDAKALDSFGRASPEVTNAYITYSVAEAKQSGFDAELSAAEQGSRSTQDAYVLSLYANALLAGGRKAAGQAAVTRLVALQDGSGAFSKASHSITRSGGQNLTAETTSLAVMALLKAGGHDEATDRAVEYLLHNRRGYGAWGATQATVLGLKALVQYSTARRRERGSGDVTVLLNGQKAGTVHYDTDDREALSIKGLGRFLQAGKNRIEFTSSGKGSLPFSLALDYRTLRPATSPQAVVDLETQLEKPQVKLGEAVRMRVRIVNKSAQGQPMTLARVELPGGLTFQNWQLKELREKGLIAFYETGPRQVNLYLRQLSPNEVVEVPLDLVAIVPGEYTAQASAAYLYYTDEHKVWVAGTRITVEP